MLFIQTKYMIRNERNEAKLEILDNAWNKLCGKLNKENVEVKSIFMSEILIKILTINPRIKKAALKEYLRCTERVNEIAFFQWRLKFPKHMKWNENELLELSNQKIL